MGLFGFGGVSHTMEQNAVAKAMDRIGAWESSGDRCERCKQYVSAEQIKSKTYGACRLYQMKVFSNRVCNNYQGRYE